MKSKPQKESTDSKKLVLTTVTPEQSLEEIYENLLKNFQRQGLEIKPSKKE